MATQNKPFSKNLASGGGCRAKGLPGHSKAVRFYGLITLLGSC